MTMPKFACRCGVTINLVRTPAPEEYLLVPEENVETAQGKFADPNSDEREILDILDEGSRSVLECSNCGRIWIQDREDQMRYHAYTREAHE